MHKWKPWEGLGYRHYKVMHLHADSGSSVNILTLITYKCSEHIDKFIDIMTKSLLRWEGVPLETLERCSTA